MKARGRRHGVAPTQIHLLWLELQNIFSELSGKSLAKRGLSTSAFYISYAQLKALVRSPDAGLTVKG
jgi:hypothetical protein